jgi:hypothetical protein
MSRSMTDDLAYLKDLAESGQNAPLLGGRFLAWWGGLVTIAYISHYLIATGATGLPNEAYAWLWIGFSVIGFGGFKVMQMTFPKSKPGASSLGNQISAVVWMAGGMVLFSFFSGARARDLRHLPADIRPARKEPRADARRLGRDCLKRRGCCIYGVQYGLARRCHRGGAHRLPAGCHADASGTI